MTIDEVKKLMKSSNSEQEWNSNCTKVKKAFGGDYPEFWYQAVILSGIAIEAQANWQ